MLQLLVTANAVPSFLIFIALVMEAIRSSRTSVLTRATLCNIPEDGIFQLNTNLKKNTPKFKGLVML
jgi:hypothetical protein